MSSTIAGSEKQILGTTADARRDLRIRYVSEVDEPAEEPTDAGELPAAVASLDTRRARLTGMVEPIELYELPPVSDHPQWPARQQQYERALTFFEQDKPAECLAACQELLKSCGGSDGPTNWLMRQAEQRLANPATPFEAVFSVETK